MFIWVRSIDLPVLDRATQTLPFLLVNTFQAIKLSIPQSSTIMPFQVVSRPKQRKIPPTSQYVQTDASWSAPTLRIKTHLFNPDDKMQRERRFLVASPK